METVVEGEVGLCTQVIVPDRGVFVVLPVPSLIEDASVQIGYLAVWRDAVSDELFIYARPLFDDGDLGHSVLNLERDRNVPLGAITVESEPLRRRVIAVERLVEDATLWQPMTYRNLWSLMGVEWEPQGGEDETEGSVALNCLPTATDDPGELDCTALLDDPTNIYDVVMVVACGSGGGGGGGGPVTTDCHSCVSDGNPCTYDFYCNDWAVIACYPNVPVGTPCPDDGNACTSDICSVPVVASGISCTHPAKTGRPACASDGNVCTNDVCVGGACTNEPVTSGTICNDGNACTTNDACSAGVCGGTASVCNDGNICTDDSCNPATGCVFTHNSALCNDNNACTTNDRCSAGACVGGPALVCNDNRVCTNDTCNSATGCVFTNNFITCNDANACTVNDRCSGGTCAGTPKVCIDTNLCTVNERCESGNCLSDPMDCSDNDGCTLNERCVNGICLNDPKNCADSDPCTPDSCVAGVCVHGHQNCEGEEDPCDPTPVINFSAHCIGCTVTITVPSTLRINCDDDDNNGVSDRVQTGPIAGENDLAQASLSWTAACAEMAYIPGDTVKWRMAEGKGNRTYRVYRNSDKTEPIDSGSGYNPWPPPSTVWLEGIAPTEECPSRVVMWVAVASAGGATHCVYCGYEGQRMTVDGPVLSWEKGIADSADLGTCPNNGGVRIFPDKVSPTDPTPALRQQVTLTATIDPPVAGITVYFKVFDVDDPFDQLNATMADVSLIDTDASGPDNRPLPGEIPWTDLDVTDANGKAQVTFTVSMQPGNNYRAVASRVATAVAQVTQADADAMNARNPASPGVAVRGCLDPLIWSPMLTVWRKLHIEIDSMQPESTVLLDRAPDWDRIAITAVSTGSTFTTLTVNGLLFGSGDLATTETDHFEGGTLASTPLQRNLTVLRNVDLFLEAEIVIEGVLTPAEQQSIIGAIDILRDDDPQSGQLPYYHALNTDAFIREAYASAYIDIVELNVNHNPNRLVPFDKELNDFDLLGGTGYDNAQDVFSSGTYWAALLVAAFQPAREIDGDPDPWVGPNNNGSALNPHYDEGFLFGVTHSDSDNASIVFLEVHRDLGVVADKDLSHTIAHEIGHSAGSGRTEAADHAEGGIMTTGAPQTEGAFTAETISRFRGVVIW